MLEVCRTVVLLRSPVKPMQAKRHTRTSRPVRCLLTWAVMTTVSQRHPVHAASRADTHPLINRQGRGASAGASASNTGTARSRAR